jgi:hypothetical protein
VDFSVLQTTHCAFLIHTATLAFLGQYRPEMDLCSSQDGGSKLIKLIIQQNNTEPTPIIKA